MAKVTVYKGKPGLTLLSWFANAMFFCGIAMAFSLQFSAAVFMVLFGMLLYCFINSRLNHQKARFKATTAGIMMIIYQIACVVDWTVGQVEMARGSYAGVAVGALLGAALLLNVVKNKPLVMTIGLVGLQFTALPTIMKMVKAIMAEFNVTGLILALLSLLPAVFAVLFLFRGEKMTPEERMQYVF